MKVHGYTVTIDCYIELDGGEPELKADVALGAGVPHSLLSVIPKHLRQVADDVEASAQPDKIDPAPPLSARWGGPGEDS